MTPHEDTDEYLVHKPTSVKFTLRDWLAVVVSGIAIATTLWTVAKSTAQYDATIISVAKLEAATRDFANIAYQVSELRKVVDKQQDLLNEQNRRLYILEARTRVR